MNQVMTQWTASSRAGSVQTAVSNSFDALTAAREIAERLAPSESECVLFFCSSQYDLHALAQALNTYLPATLVVGCTTAGELSKLGVTANSISAVSFPKSHFTCELTVFDGIGYADPGVITGDIKSMLARLEKRAARPLQQSTFAFSLLDGLSSAEELMLPVMCEALGDIPLCGGSAADAMDFRDTYVFANGEFHRNAAAIVVMNTCCPFQIFSSNHFVAGDEKLVVTRADADNRSVLELNAEPAALEYGRVMGLSLDDLNSQCFAKHPLGVRVGEHLYVRSIRQLNDDLSLTFFCAIDQGIILSKLEDTGLLNHFTELMSSVAEQLGEVQATVAFDCIHRVQEAKVKGLLDPLNALYQAHNVVGFNTYGEHFGGLHVNHSFTGIAIGYPDE